MPTASQAQQPNSTAREMICDTVVLGVSGAVGATEIPQLIVLLRREFCRRVQVVMTRTAEQFLTAFAAEVFSGQPVGTSSELPKPSDWQNHIRLAKEASLLLIAPATANMIARLATGLAEDLVSTVALAATCPKVIAPAMNIRMFENEITQRNLRELRERGFYIIEPVVGIEVTTMEVSYGSMPQPRDVARFLFNVMAANSETQDQG